MNNNTTMHQLTGKMAGAVFLALLFVSSCYYDKEDKLYDEYYARKQCDTTVVTYSLTIQPLVAAKCATSGCHTAGGTGSGNFDTYAGVKAKVDNGSFLNRTTILRDMPTSGPLSACEIAHIEKWIREGALNN